MLNCSGQKIAAHLAKNKCNNKAWVGRAKNGWDLILPKKRWGNNWLWQNWHQSNGRMAALVLGQGYGFDTQ